MTVAIDSVVVPERKRPLGDVTELARSIDELGLLNPITVTPDKTLIAGRHRLEACRLLGWSEIEATVVDLDDLGRELAEIDENLIRNELTVLERSEHLARRKAIYRALHGEARGGDRRSGEEIKVPTTGTLKEFYKEASAVSGRSATTVRDQVRIAERIPDDVREDLRELPTADNQKELLELARLEPDEQRKVVAKLKARPDKPESVREASRKVDYEKKQAEPLGEMVGLFDIVYADPPWQYGNAGFKGAAADHYPTMPTEDICRLPVRDKTVDDGVLFLWATNPLLPDALQVMAAWGYEYKTNIVWVKDRGTHLGFYVQGFHELLLIGVRGKMLPYEKPLPRSVLEAARRKHSQKPDEGYDIIERMYPGLSYVEMFYRHRGDGAKHHREGWVGWGNEPA